MATADGIGDFKGLMTKLDYLQELGVTAIWVLPFYPSPLKDDGYDIADYYSINPSYGNINQFKQFLEEAHRRNLKVITELVINHTSDQHPWFQRARLLQKDLLKEIFMYGQMIQINGKMFVSSSQILKQATGPGILLHNNIIGTVSFTINPI